MRIKNTLLRKKFVMELHQFMKKENLNGTGLAWLMEVRDCTAYNWLNGVTLPNRDNAFKLAFFSTGIRKTFEKLAGVDDAKNRLRDLGYEVKKAS